MQKYTARNSFSGVLGYIFSKFSTICLGRVQNLPKFWSAKDKGLKVSDAHPYPPLYRSPPGNVLLQTSTRAWHSSCSRARPASRDRETLVMELEAGKAAHVAYQFTTDYST